MSLSFVAGVVVALGLRSAAALDTQRAAPIALQPAVLNPAIRELFEQLASDDPKLRDDATQHLANYGALIRPALLQASRHAQPLELRFRAARVLCQMPWIAPQDPPAVQSVLQDYRSTEPEARAATVRRLGAVVGEAAFDALLRLLAEEPSEDVRWTIVQQLRGYAAPALRSRLRGELQPAGDDLPVLAAHAWGWQSSDPERAAALFRRCADLAAARGCGDDQGEAALMLKELLVRATNRGERDDAARIMRRLVLMGAEPQLELFVLHAQHGPCAGFDEDVRRAGEGFFDSPEVLYVLGRMHARRNEPLLSTACYRAAGLSALSSQSSHKRVAEFLLAKQWYELAEVEYQAAIATPGDDKAVHDADAFVGLSRCAAGRGDDAAAAEFLSTALQLARKLPGRIVDHEAEFHAEIDWHALRAARTRGDWTEVADRADALLGFERAAQAAAAERDRGAAANGQPQQQQQRHYESPMHGEMAIDVVASLKHLRRAADAAPIFQHFFDYYRAELDADPHGADALNNLAWLCARCGEHIDEAVAWSTEAIRLAPANAAYLDTAAEAAAQQRRWEEAVRLESAALKLQPGDRFMLSQLDRFKQRLSDSKK
jgi:tetratricopeptide (TPR) repeat protein